jgi:peptidoglycan/xylan/chitin deacetylase (PgdA/CDA1 family)
MITGYIKKFISGISKDPVIIVLFLYTILISLFVLGYTLILHNDIKFFLNDDGYYVMGRYVYEGRITLMHQYRSPGILFFFSLYHYLPEIIHPYLRLLITVLLTYGNLYLASRIFENILTKRQMLIGLFLSVFNPVYLHFSFKSTPEIYLVFFTGLIIFYYRKYLIEYSKKYLFYTILVVIAGMSFKPVFFLISFFLIVHSILTGRFKKLAVPLTIFSILSIIILLISSNLTKPLTNEPNVIIVESLIVPTFLPDAIMKTKELNLGTKEEYLLEKQDKSNLFICMEMYNQYLSDYKLNNTDYSESAIVLDFIKKNFIKFTLVKLFSPITLISLSSSTSETVLNFFLNIFLIILCIVSIKKIYKKKKDDVLIILSVILGYSFVFFLASCYIRYSMPVLFFLYPFSGIVISSALSKLKFKFGFDPKIEKMADFKKFIPESCKSVVLFYADFELAWAWRYSKNYINKKEEIIKIADRERENIPEIVKLCEEHNIPITWATVGHLFLEECSKKDSIAHPDLPRNKYYENDYWVYDKGDWFDDDPCNNYKKSPQWYCPDLIKNILDSKLKHEIGCHTFSHIDCREEVCAPEVIKAELTKCKESAEKFNIILKSFVHPGHTIGNLESLVECGFESYRTDYGNILGYPERHSNGLWEIKGTMELTYRKKWDIDFNIQFYKTIIDRAIKNNSVCVFWFHPSFDKVCLEKIIPELFTYLNNKKSEVNVMTVSDYINFLNNNK